MQVEDFNFSELTKEVRRKEQARDHTDAARSHTYDPNVFRDIAVLLVKYKLMLQCVLNMSAEEIIEGFKARGITDNKVIADNLVILVQRWHVIGNEVVRGLIPKKPSLSEQEALYTTHAIDYIWDCKTNNLRDREHRDRRLASQKRS